MEEYSLHSDVPTISSSNFTKKRIPLVHNELLIDMAPDKIFKNPISKVLFSKTHSFSLVLNTFSATLSAKEQDLHFFKLRPTFSTQNGLLQTKF